MNIQTAVRISKNDDFKDRVNYLIVKAAIANLNGTPDPADIILGQRILDGLENLNTWVTATLTNPTFMAGAHDDTGNTILDSDLEFQVNSLWTAFKL